MDVTFLFSILILRNCSLKKELKEREHLLFKSLLIDSQKHEKLYMYLSITPFWGDYSQVCIVRIQLNSALVNLASKYILIT